MSKMACGIVILLCIVLFGETGNVIVGYSNLSDFDDTFYLDNIESTALPLEYTTVIINCPRHGTIQIRSSHDPPDVGPITSDNSMLLRFSIHVAKTDTKRICSRESSIRLIVDNSFTYYINSEPCNEDESIDWFIVKPWQRNDIFGEHEVKLQLLDPSGREVATESSTFLFLPCSNASDECDEEELGTEGNRPLNVHTRGDVEILEVVASGRRTQLAIGRRSHLVRVTVTELFSFACSYRVAALLVAPRAAALHGRAMRRAAADGQHTDLLRACPAGVRGAAELRVSVRAAGCASQFSRFDWAAQEIASVAAHVNCSAAADHDTEVSTAGCGGRARAAADGALGH